MSTAFANCDRSEAREILYPAKSDWRKLIEIAEKFDKQVLAALTQKFMDHMPNTYCFTKQIAEHVVNDMCKGRIPAKIFRPSIGAPFSRLLFIYTLMLCFQLLVVCRMNRLKDGSTISTDLLGF